MATKIITKYGSGAPTTSDVQRGELAVDTENGRLYTLNSSSAVVEIGVNTASNLDVTGTATAASFETDAGGTFTTASGNDLNIVYPTSRSLFIKEGSETHVTVDNAGQVGIGASPAEKLHVAGAIATTAGISGHGANRATFSQEGANGAFIQSYGADTSTMGAFTFRQASSDFSVNAIPLTISATGNVGIGVSSLVTGSTRRVLQVSTGSDGGQLALADSTTEAANPRIFATNKEDLKLSTANTATGTIQFITGSTPTERMRIDSSGNVGINTASPNSYAGYTTLTIDNATNGGLIDFEANGTRVSTFFGNASQTNFGTVTSTPLVLITNNTERMRIDSSGNLLVGKTSTSGGIAGSVLAATGLTRLTASGIAVAEINRLGSGGTENGSIVDLKSNGTSVGSIGTANGDSITIGNSTGNLILYAATVAPASTSAGGASNGVVDLGTSARRFKDLYLSGNTQMGGNLDVVGQISSYDNVGGSYGTMNVRALDIVYKSSGGSERMRLDSSGNLLVGTSSSVARIHASISSASLPAVAFENTNTGSSGVGVITTSVPSTANNTNCFHLKSTTQGVASYYLYGNGSSSFTSDERQKKNIVTTRDGYLDDLKNLRVVDYHWNNQEDTEDKNIGLIAQEVEQVFPNLVVEHELEGAGVRKNLKSSDFTFILIKAIQEQQDLIESLTARIAALEGAN